MNQRADSRVPLVFADAAAAGPEDAVLREGRGGAAAGCEWFVAAHRPACPCCATHSAAAQALNRLWLARGRGDGLFFRRVVVETRSDAGRKAVADALLDPLVSANYRK